MYYQKFPHKMLPNPRSAIPFHVQAYPIPDPLQVHPVTEQRRVIASAYNQSNRLPTGRFLGTDWTQNNQPHFLGANERIVFEDSW